MHYSLPINWRFWYVKPPQFYKLLKQCLCVLGVDSSPGGGVAAVGGDSADRGISAT